MTQPLVSVIIPVYNGERYLAQTIESVLAQTYRPVEIVVVDDGSTDGTAVIAQSYQDIRYIHQENQGHGRARHVGVRASRGEFLAFLDADDVWAPEKLHVQVEYLQRHPHVGYVICNMRNVPEPGQPRPAWLTEELLGEIPAYIPSALVVRRTVVEQIGDFDARYRRANDVDWHLRARDAGIVMANVDRLLLYRRVHSSNLTHDRGVGTAAATELFQALKASVTRKRERGTGTESAREDDDAR